MRPIRQEPFFAREIATGAKKLKSLLGNRIVAAMLGRDGGRTDELTQAKLLMLFAEHRMGWKEAVADTRANEDHHRFIVLRKNMGFPGTPVIAISSSTRLGSRGVTGAWLTAGYC